ncbi:MAG: tRNA (adenosine(37)-N6)-dimethylallyltransferase MiaA [Dehalococcoidia bacterium]|nr:tRNA (adenosine(37)-N6)-dimethylallyltransferase MiaA [Dehalococcoidia bacterium]
MPKLIAIVGATATGKTALAVELARRLDGRAEAIGADSRQVYRRLDIGTAKPTSEEQAAARHHLIDVVEPDQPFSLGQWLVLAQAALDGVWSRPDGRPSGRDPTPLVVGGTGQYVWALLEGWRVPRVPARAELRRELGSRTPESLLAELRRADPQAESYIDPRNVRRLVRALEVYRETGKPFSYWRTKEAPAFASLVIGLRLERQELYRRIGERVERMVEAGFVEEVRGLLAMGYSRDLPCLSGIGYREMCEHLAGERDLPSAVERTKTGTHRLARHQNTWFKADDPRIHWIEAGEGAADEAWALVREFADRRLGVRG